MSVYVMLTVDLNRNVPDEKRKKFNAYLKKEKWEKLKLTTTWYASFVAGVSETDAIDTTKSDVKNAALNAGISHYEAAAEAGKKRPEVWNQSSQ